ncbi:PspC domain-containing protein [Haloechinothrix halophila]|uniref:Putative stress-responsive transcriptional regulator n=1 Tax=Haloechinothrix halophila YIM 93223 TaxID=592678 RepID=W9DN58_9PSEU|nr:PspC domain-containing protein [Haloechinothrix halophila]ETA66328.1 putative stress-responsive transcriptional regulator [Haloechinothrix halophila YIM 93223]
MTPPAGNRPSARDSIEDTAKDFWSTRPRRPRRGKKLAGVAAGIGNRYGIDPVLVRVGFVVATIVGGFGILLYLLGWLFLPEEGDEVSGAESLLGKGRSSMSPGLAIVLGLVLFPVMAGTFSGSWLDGGGFVLLALFLVGLYALHRSRGDANRPLPTSAAAGPATFFAHSENDMSATDSAAATTAPIDATTPQATATADTTPGTTAAAPGPGYGDIRGTGASDVTGPNGWDPLGAAPLGWDLPGADAPQPPHAAAAPTMPMARPRPKSRISYVAAGLALLTASVGLALGVSGVDWFTAAHVIGLTLGVLGVGMVAASFAGAGRGLVLLALPLAAVGIALTAIPFDRLPGGGIGEVNATPTSLAELEPVYQRTMGAVHLDLTQLDDVDTTDEPIETAIDVGMGEAVVEVPADADVTFTCDANMGEVSCLGKTSEGMGMAPVSGTSDGEGEGGQQITLDVSTMMGSVVIERG